MRFIKALKEHEIEFVQEIPSPYRVDFLNAIEKVIPGIYVHFLAENQTHRPKFWNRSLEKAKFRYVIWKDFGLRFRGRKIHLNLGLIWRLLSSRGPIIVGGVWSNLTVLLICLFFAKKCVAWIELNEALLRPSPLARYVKRRLISRFPAVIVPGALGKKALSSLKYSGEVIELPNLIDGASFKVDPLERSKSRRQETKIAIWPARFIKNKGIVEFISQLSPDMLQGWMITIVGEGNLRSRVESIILERNLDPYFQLLGYVPYERMREFYGTADLFLLPSLHDPNPLSAIEALHAGLPILLSKYCGNFPEVIEEGNGWVVDPLADNRKLLFDIFRMTRQELAVLGTQSARIAIAKFDMDVNARKFIDNLSGHVAY